MRRGQTHFHFKQFSIDHSNATMKVGTDGVLLGAWVNVEGAKRILDIGTGSGVIALMLAQRTDASSFIDAVEIELTDAEQAKENVSRSPWPEKVKVHCTSIQNFQPGLRYDLILSNPPYFINSFESPDKKRHQTRHTAALSHEDLLKTACRLMNPQGTFNVILPYVEGLQFINLAQSYGLHCSRHWTFRSREGKPVERLLLEFSLTEKDCNKGEILLYERDEEWSSGYKALTQEFYLKR